MSTADWKWFAGGEVDECSLLLRFFGDDLDPNTITALLGVPPTEAARKGHRLTNSRAQSPARTGIWLLDCERTDDTPESQVKLLFGDLPDDLAVWNKLANTYSAELKCHLFLKRWNRGTIFSPDTLAAIAARRLCLNLDIYTPLERDA